MKRISLPWGDVEVSEKVSQADTETLKPIAVYQKQTDVITQEEYEQTYKPQGWKLLIIGPTSTWRESWTEWEAIRDIVQNSLDESESYTTERVMFEGATSLVISDNGQGVQIADFLLGPPKLKPEWARGRFGEGMKLAALTLIRLGYGVRVSTSGREIRMVFYEQSVNGKAKTLAALWRSNGTTAGTKFYIVGYTGNDFADRFVANLGTELYSGSAEEAFRGYATITKPFQRFNQLIAKPVGRLYSRDIYMREIKSPWSYNLWGFDLAPDRHAPAKEDDIYLDIGRLWMTCADSDLIAKFLRLVEQTLGEKTIEYHTRMVGWPTTYNIFKQNKSKWLEGWVKAFGPTAVLTTQSSLSNLMIHLGFKPIGITWGVADFLKDISDFPVDISQALIARKKMAESQIIADSDLDPKALKHLVLARSLASEFTPTPEQQIVAAIIPPVGNAVRTAGAYGKTSQMIMIDMYTLDFALSTIDTLVHELGHFITNGADDLTDRFIDAVSEVAGKIIKNVSQRKHDAVFKDIDWWG